MVGHLEAHEINDPLHDNEIKSASGNQITTEKIPKKRVVEQKAEKLAQVGKVDKYPTLKTYTKYAESLKLSDLRQKYSYLDDYLTTRKISSQFPKSNPFNGLKDLSLDELRELTENFVTSEKQFQKKFPSVANKISKKSRIHLGVVDSLRKIIHKENLEEIKTKNRLLGPKCITFRKIYDGKNKSVLYPEEAELIDPKRKIEELSMSDDIEETTMQPTIADNASNISHSTQSKPTQSNIFADELKNYLSIETSEGSKTNPYKMCKPELIKRTRHTCLINLAARTKLAEINRIDKIMEDEKAYLVQREQQLAKRSLAHDEHLKQVCKETADMINAAEAEAVRKKKIADEIKSRKYELAHLNAECVKLEERCTVLLGYKEFLLDVGETCLKEKIEHVLTKEEIDVRKHLIELLSNKPKFDVAWEELSDDHINDQMRQMELMFQVIFQQPMKLVDLLIELESGNLTLIETVQEQKEMCDNYRQKAQALESSIFSKKDTTMLSIEAQIESCERLKKEAREMEEDFHLIERQFRALKYMKEFNVGFRNLPPKVRESSLTLNEVLNMLRIELKKAHNGIFENCENSDFSAIEMLKRMEQILNDLNNELVQYSFDQIQYAKKIVTQQKYMEQRKLAAQEAALAYQRRLEKTMAEALKPPRYHVGRRLVYRSKPPIQYKPPKSMDLGFDLPDRYPELRLFGSTLRKSSNPSDEKHSEKA